MRGGATGATGAAGRLDAIQASASATACGCDMTTIGKFTTGTDK